MYSIVVTYNGSQWVQKCFKSLVESDIANHQILAIDNGSTDNTLDLIRRNYPTVEIIETGQNLGFGQANNIGMKKALQANADYAFLLNQDAWIEKDTIKLLIETSTAHENFGILSPLQYATNGSLDEQFSKYLIKTTPLTDELIEVKFTNAAGWLITRNCLLQVGSFSNLFYHYGEDRDYCYRAKYHGFKIGVVKTTAYIHDRNQFREDLSLDKQINQIHINQKAILANINYPVILLILIQLLSMISHCLNLSKNKTFTNKAIIVGTLKAQAELRNILRFRKISKKNGAFNKL